MMCFVSWISGGVGSWDPLCEESSLTLHPLDFMILPVQRIDGDSVMPALKTGEPPSAVVDRREVIVVERPAHASRFV